MYSLATPICTSSLRAAEDLRVLGLLTPLVMEPRTPMFTPSCQDALASTVSSAKKSGQAEPVRHMLFGSLSAVQATIKDLHKCRYAEPNDWSQPISTGRPNEVMAILTKRVSVE